MTDLADELGRDLGIPVVDGVAAATKAVESLIALGLRTSLRGEYAPPPPPKPYHGLLASFVLNDHDAGHAGDGPLGYYRAADEQHGRAPFG